MNYSNGWRTPSLQLDFLKVEDSVDFVPDAKPLKPNLILKNPIPLSSGELQQLRYLTFLDKTGGRKNYLALSDEEQILCLYQDRKTSTFYLYGYLD